MKEQLESVVLQMYKAGIRCSEAVREFQKAFILAVLKDQSGNQCSAAKILGIHRNTLRRAIRALETNVHNRKLKSFTTVVMFVFLLLFGSSNTIANRTPQETYRILFVGNSLTAANNMPQMVQALIDSTHSRRFEVHVVMQPGASLDDQWDSGEAARTIQSGKWNIVILQQGPSALPESRVVLVNATRKFARVIRESGATPALYMVWPAAIRLADFDSVRESYVLATRSVEGIFFPAGEAWRAAWRRNC
jgi:hypothetical protein